MESRATLHTAKDLLKLSSEGEERYELVEGELIEMPPAGGLHGKVALRLGSRINAHVEQHRLGEAFAAETGFFLAHSPDTVRAPDVAFVSAQRMPIGSTPVGYVDLVPDFVAEVVSPSDSASAVQAKTEDWLRAGVRLVWVVYPDTRTVVVHRTLKDVTILHEGDTLDGGDVLPGFSVPVAELF